VRRLRLRLLIVVLLLLAAIQVVFTPIRFVRWTPEWQSPRVGVNLGLDLQGGSYLVLEAKDTATVKVTPDAVDAAMRVIENRIDQLGVAEPTLQRQGMVEPMQRWVANGLPFLGICLGAQLMLDASEEDDAPAASSSSCPASRIPSGPSHCSARPRCSSSSTRSSRRCPRAAAGRSTERP